MPPGWEQEGPCVRDQPLEEQKLFYHRGLEWQSGPAGKAVFLLWWEPGSPESFRERHLVFQTTCWLT